MDEGDAPRQNPYRNTCPKPPPPPAPGIDKEHDKKLRQVKKQAELLSLRIQEGGLKDVEALALLLEFAGRLYGNDKRGALTDLGIVVGGLDTTHVSPRRISERPEDNDPLRQYYVGYSSFVPKAGTDTGFANSLNPHNDNQVRHFIAGAAGGNAPTGVIGRAYMLMTENAPEDRALYRLAFSFDDWLIGNPALPFTGYPLSEAGNWVRDNLAP